MNTHNVYFNQFVNVEENYNRLALSMGAEVLENFYLKKYLPQHRKDEYYYPYIAINNTCSDLSLERKCPETLLAEVAVWILNNTNYSLAFTGAPSDNRQNQFFIDQYLVGQDQNRIRNVAGEFSFDHYYQFLYTQCAMMLTIDSAPLHIAKKLGVPTLSLWGPTNPVNLSKKDDRNSIYYLAKDCSPCVHHTETLPCGGNNTCMKDMDKNTIIAHLTTLLAIIQKK